MTYARDMACEIVKAFARGNFSPTDAEGFVASVVAECARQVELAGVCKQCSHVGCVAARQAKRRIRSLSTPVPTKEPTRAELTGEKP